MDLEGIIDRLDIVTVMRGEGVFLRKRGVNYTGLCPFHNEKTPSFVVSPAKGIGKCFGCGVGGDVVHLVAKLKDFSFKESILYLSEKYGLPVDENLQQEAEEYQKMRERKVELMRFVKTFETYFKRELEKNPEVKDYLKKRGLSAESIKRFHLGWAPHDQEDFLQHNFTKEQQEKQLMDLGLLVQGFANVSYLKPRFNERLMFPIYNSNDELVGFGGRILKKSKHIAKYMNSPESELFKKQSILYGLTKETIKLISQYDRVVLVEGYMDVIQAWEQGIPQNGWPVIATMGTSLTENQLRLIKRFTKNVYIMDDGDKAGLNAINRSIPLFMGAGLNPNVFILSDEKDPDDIFREQGITFFEQNTSLDFYDFKKYFFIQQTGMSFEKFSTTQKYDFLESTLEDLMNVPDLSKNFIWVERFKEDFDNSITLQAYADLLNKQRFYQKGFQEEVRNSFVDFSSEQKLVIAYLYSDTLQRDEIKRRYVDKIPLSPTFYDAIKSIDQSIQKYGDDGLQQMRANDMNFDHGSKSAVWLFLNGYVMKNLREENKFPSLKMVDLAISERLFEIALTNYSKAKQKGNLEEANKYFKIMDGLSNDF